MPQGRDQRRQEDVLDVLRKQETILEEKLLEVHPLTVLSAPQLAEHLQAGDGQDVRLDLDLRGCCNQNLGSIPVLISWPWRLRLALRLRVEGHQAHDIVP